MMRVAGLGSFTPKASTAVNDATYVPVDGNKIAPGVAFVLELGTPAGKYHQ
jgi:hypothetical protein